MEVTIHQAYSRRKFPCNIGAVCIVFFQQTNYSHYALSVKDPATNEVFFYDSTGAGTRKYRPSVFRKKYKLTRSFVVSKEITYIDWLEFWGKHANKQYGFIQLLGLFLKLWNIVSYNPFGAGSKRIICNELIVLFLNHFGYTSIVDTDSLDLNDTEDILEKVL